MGKCGPFRKQTAILQTIYVRPTSFEPMKRFTLYGLLLLLFLLFAMPACAPSGKYTATVVKPKYHKGFFDRKKDKGKKRTKKVRVRS